MNKESNQPVHEEEDIEFYGDPGIVSKNARVPKWLVFSNWFWVFFGLMWFYLFWNGSFGWFDRGYWNQLQRAANTVYPFTTEQLVQEEFRSREMPPQAEKPF